MRIVEDVFDPRRGSAIAVVNVFLPLLPPSSAYQSYTNHSSTHNANSTSTQPKIHQPLAQRIGAKAIPIVDPSTRTVASPPPSVSPARQLMQAQQFIPGASAQVW